MFLMFYSVLVIDYAQRLFSQQLLTQSKSRIQQLAGIIQLRSSFALLIEMDGVYPQGR